MTVPVPAGAGGVDESDRHCKSCGDRRMRHMPNDGSCTWCDCPSFVPEVTRAELEAALAAAEQRADTAAADERVRIADEIEAARSCSACADFYSGKPTARHDLELGCAPTCPCNHEHARWVGYSDGALTRIAAQVRAALSSRPVQPDTERSET